MKSNKFGKTRKDTKWKKRDIVAEERVRRRMRDQLYARSGQRRTDKEYLFHKKALAKRRNIRYYLQAFVKRKR